MNLAVSGYKINTQKSLEFLYTKNEKSERRSKESIPLTTATKRIKCVGINLHKEREKLYTENYDTNKRNQRRHKWSDIACSWIERINIVKHC